MQTFHRVEVDFAAVASDQATNRQIAWPQPLIQRRKFGLRLHDDAAPAALVEPEGHIVRDRMPGADIDIGPGGLSREGKRQVIVLEILCVGEVHSRSRLSSACNSADRAFDRAPTGRSGRRGFAYWLNKMGPRECRVKRIGKILRFVGHQSVAEFHDAHGVGWFAIIAKHEFSDPEIAAADHSPGPQSASCSAERTGSPTKKPGHARIRLAPKIEFVVMDQSDLPCPALLAKIF